MIVYPVVNNALLSRAIFRGRQGAATSNSAAIARSCNAARREKAPQEWCIIYDGVHWHSPVRGGLTQRF